MSCMQHFPTISTPRCHSSQGSRVVLQVVGMMKSAEHSGDLQVGKRRVLAAALNVSDWLIFSQLAPRSNAKKSEGEMV